MTPSNLPIPPRLRDRVRLFLELGLLCGGLATAWATFLNLVSRGAVLVRLGTTLGRIAAVYFAGGLVGGFLLALAWPRQRVTLLRAAMLGVLAMAPLYALVSVASQHHGGPWADDIGFAIGAACLIGATVGVTSWLDAHPRGSVAPWIDAFRYPALRTVLRLWLGAGTLAGLAWVIGGRWAGRWPAVIAIFLFVLPLGFAALVTVVTLRPAHRPPSSGAA